MKSLFLVGQQIPYVNFLSKKKECENPLIKNLTMSNAVWVFQEIRFLSLTVLFILMEKEVFYPKELRRNMYIQPTGQKASLVGNYNLKALKTSPVNTVLIILVMKAIRRYYPISMAYTLMKGIILS